MIGSELGGRYEIVERIGGGGMAIVYKAYDTLLHRHVAVKVLREQFVHDEEFIQRFRREARSAASLSHPNVVSIYDVGQDEDIHYIVMEYIEGGTLNDIIKERAPLQAEEAVKIASQICDALDHAHQNGIIHRDIKPHNILISKSGRIKVTDFGIARAAASSHITQTGAVLGSVHYFSPEHAKGVAQGEKSDIYSLGAVLYQMVTNRLPFAGDSPISVALKHLQEDFEEPRSINPLLPQSLENIILKALRKRPEERYESARAMLEDLETCLLPERRDERKVFYEPEDDDDEKTIIMPAIREYTAAVNHGQEDEEMPQTRGRIAESLADEPKRRRWVKPTIWIAVVLVLFFGTWQGVKAVMSLFDVPEVDVPNVVGEHVDDAVRILEDLNLKVQFTEDEYSDIYEQGYVIRQSQADILVKEGSTIHLTVSLGPLEQEMPDLTEMLEHEARNLLVELGFSRDAIEIVESYNDLPKGSVVSHEPAAGEKVNPRSSQVTLVVSQGPGTESMPNLIGDTLQVARNKLEILNLNENVKIEEAPDYTQPAGHVFRQWPFEPNDPVSPGAEITLYVSTGLPSDAIQTEKVITVEPAVEGVASTIEIYITDASKDNVLWGTKEITQRTTYRVGIVVSPTQNATILIQRDGAWLDTQTVTYSEARLLQSGGGQTGTPEPPAGPDEEAVEAEVLDEPADQASWTDESEAIEGQLSEGQG
ncbi:serine/threonine-protein kinase PrkC [Insulibacter thermoxylanivorax]|uniref:Serine/threonine-protein kinase PrkC n=1 Tax=Insulibacter thermoxylanivorax TaxID=2749268 RepID=A0A916QF44_9BACL|nr:Stk1 family PASTA domain-containing Ser/Thr kinase [Insulibacter thermoxylanivorax]GFR37794.1 serine/threonine-protein kinase PrkC [Insulibacter thermoxylanivorax]